MSNNKQLVLKDDPELQEVYGYLFSLHKKDYKTLLSGKPELSPKFKELLYIDEKNIEYLASILP